MLEIIKLVPHILKVYLETSLYQKNVFLYQKGKKSYNSSFKICFYRTTKKIIDVISLCKNVYRESHGIFKKFIIVVLKYVFTKQKDYRRYCSL
jgi:hypothetical protein